MGKLGEESPTEINILRIKKRSVVELITGRFNI